MIITILTTAIGVLAPILTVFIVFTKNWEDRPVKEQLRRWYWEAKANSENRRGIRRSAIGKDTGYVWYPDGKTTLLFTPKHDRTKAAFTEEDAVLQGYHICPGMIGELYIHDIETRETVWGRDDRYYLFLAEDRAKDPSHRKLIFVEQELPTRRMRTDEED